LTSSPELGAADLLSAEALQRLSDGVIPTRAVVIVESQTLKGSTMNFMVAKGTTTWQALGMIRSAQLQLELLDLNMWRAE